MRIEIEIPKEFEEHFKKDKFTDSLERIMADIKYSLENGDCLCAGRYEYETIEMLQKAFENSKPAYSVDEVVEELEQHYDDDSVICGLVYNDAIKKAIEIVKQSGVSDDVCECRLLKGHKFLHETSCGDVFDMQNGFKYCPYCGKKIKVVE